MLILFFVIILSIALGLFSLILRILRKPIGLLFKLFLNAVSGFVFLGIFNVLGSFFELSLGFNWLNAIITGTLGIPGVVLLLLVRYLL